MAKIQNGILEFLTHPSDHSRRKEARVEKPPIAQATNSQYDNVQLWATAAFAATAAAVVATADVAVDVTAAPVSAATAPAAATVAASAPFTASLSLFEVADDW